MYVALVLSTGALSNLNHIYAGQEVVKWFGFWIFFVSLLVIAASLLAARPLVLAPIASLFGKMGRYNAGIHRIIPKPQVPRIYRNLRLIPSWPLRTRTARNDVPGNLLANRTASSR